MRAISYRRAAKMTGYTDEYVSRVMRGLRTPSLPAAVAIAGAYGMAVEELWTRVSAARQKMGLSPTLHAQP